MKRNEMDWILLAMTLFEAAAFSMLAFYNGFDFVPLILAVSMPLLLIAQIALLGRAFPHMDRIMLSCANFLCGLGIIMLYRLDPEKALKQLLFYGLGVMVMVCMTVMVARMRRVAVAAPAGDAPVRRAAGTDAGDRQGNLRREELD